MKKLISLTKLKIVKVDFNKILVRDKNIYKVWDVLSRSKKKGKKRQNKVPTTKYKKLQQKCNGTHVSDLILHRTTTNAIVFTVRESESNSRERKYYFFDFYMLPFLAYKAPSLSLVRIFHKSPLSFSLSISSEITKLNWLFVLFCNRECLQRRRRSCM